MRVGLVIVLAAAAAFFAFRGKPSDGGPSHAGASSETPGPEQKVPDPQELHDKWMLNDSAQEYIWEIERRAHHLQFELCSNLELAIRRGDPEPWEKVFGTHEVEMPKGEGKRLDLGFASIERWESGSPVPVREMIRELHAFLAPMKVIDRCHVHVCDLSPATYGDLEGAWTGTWAIELEAQAEDGGRHEFNSRFVTHFSRLPLQPGGGEDFMTGFTVKWVERRSAPRPMFEEVTDTCGIDWKLLLDTHRDKRATVFHETALLDYDRDGWLDVLVLDPPQQFLYRGVGGGKFEDATIDANLLMLPVRDAYIRAVTVGDFDNDGFEDLVVDLQTPDGSMQPAVLRNDGKGRFVDVPEAKLPSPMVGSGTVFDFDGDGLLDILRPNTKDPLPDFMKQARFIGDRAGRPSVLLRNKGGFVFEDVTDAAGAGTGYRDIFAAGAADLDLDGDPDVFLANHMGENVVLRNDGKGKFAEEAYAAPFGGFSMGLTMGDLDNDGDADAYVANMSSRAGHRVFMNLRKEDYPPGVHEIIAAFFSGDEILRNDDGGGFPVMGRKTNGWAYGPSMADMDGDGLLDVYVPAGYQSVDPKEPDG